MGALARMLPEVETPWDTIPDDLLVTVASFLHTPNDLLNYTAACHRTLALPTDHLWRALCETRWNAWPRYALTAERNAWFTQHQPDLGWRARYRHVEADAARTSITIAELVSHHWFFNFSPSTGGQGRLTLKQARFTDKKLILPGSGYPALGYELVEEEIEGSEVGGAGCPRLTPS